MAEKIYNTPLGPIISPPLPDYRRNGDIFYKRIYNDPDGMRYELLKEYVYYSELFNRTITIPKGRKSDGATGARDLGADETGWRWWWAKFAAKYMKTRSTKRTAAWFVHDEICTAGAFDDGYKVSNIVASTILANILHHDGYTTESIVWWWATFLFGGDGARGNGMLWIK